VLTGIPWRTTWKYRERGYRHLFWDAGAIVANLLAVAAAAGWDARVLLGFVDGEVSALLGIGQPEEYPLALVTVAAPVVAQATGSPPLEPISPRTRPLSRSPRSYPLGAAAQRAGELSSAEAVSAWRSKASRLPAQPATRSLAAGEAGQARAASDTIETVILRRGSTRRFARQSIPRGALGWAMAAASRAVPGDFVPPHATLLEHLLAVHAVEGLTSGAYRWHEGEFRLLRAGAERGRTRSLCLGQDLGGDAAATVFHGAQLEPILQALGTRLPGRPAGGRRRRRAAAAGGVRARRWRHRAHLPGRRGLGVLRHPCRPDAHRRGRGPRLSGTAGQAPDPAATYWRGGNADHAGHFPNGAVRALNRGGYGRATSR
jgi:hypothetical protein